MKTFYYESKPFALFSLGFYALSQSRMSGMMLFSGALLLTACVLITRARLQYRGYIQAP